MTDLRSPFSHASFRCPSMFATFQCPKQSHVDRIAPSSCLLTFVSAYVCSHGNPNGQSPKTEPAFWYTPLCVCVKYPCWVFQWAARNDQNRPWGHDLKASPKLPGNQSFDALGLSSRKRKKQNNPRRQATLRATASDCERLAAVAMVGNGWRPPATCEPII